MGRRGRLVFAGAGLVARAAGLVVRAAGALWAQVSERLRCWPAWPSYIRDLARAASLSANRRLCPVANLSRCGTGLWRRLQAKERSRISRSCLSASDRLRPRSPNCGTRRNRVESRLVDFKCLISLWFSCLPLSGAETRRDSGAAPVQKRNRSAETTRSGARDLEVDGAGLRSTRRVRSDRGVLRCRNTPSYSWTTK
jgi:hypothetical protein